jgi:hypothetical protein
LEACHRLALIEGEKESKIHWREVEVKATETPTGQFDYRRWKIPILVSVVLIVLMLVSLLVIVPLVFPERFVSCSFELQFISGPGHPGMEVVYLNGGIVLVMFVYPRYRVTNSYFTPVHIRYNGFEDAILIYNHTVDDPADIAENENWLVWGGFHSSQYSWSYQSFENKASYEYYTTRRNLSNYTKKVPVQGTGGTSFYAPMFGAVWMGQDMSGNPVSSGPYYLYCIEYGIVSKPVNLTITSILWTK